MFNITVIIFLAVILGIGAFTAFFDQAVIVRRGTIYRIGGTEKLVALTFDDGPSAEWTPKILDALARANIKATFFMIGEHIEQYPEVARRVAGEGHDIGNHTYDHHVLVYYTMEELEQELSKNELLIKEVTGGVSNRYFRPPKAWLTPGEKKKLKELGYRIILWTLNSKDWVSFDYRYTVKYLTRKAKPGDIILFHDGGAVFSSEGGDRSATVKVIPLLAERLKEKGYRFVTISELLERQKINAQKQ
ncbi:MAG: polysaccharide deacetylase family protein [Candidatus Omnitrophota bacterium]|nr:polysaccharide deacetylase family protein [Candidatus Omnitrophota bacterium]